ncbi:MAG: lipid-A-disaccharide synthase [Ignavibacteria bacterium]|nr:MAG: lipid-A-disaccharide synthase [Ignavibacteria bacterium]
MISLTKEKSKNKLMIISGEVSGDLIGASLIKELKELDENIAICGIGGDKMQAEGMELIYHINKMAFLGFTEVVKHLPFIKKVQTDLLAIVKKREIKNVVLIDYPGFNLNIAKKFKKNGMKIIYYISPQLWAWGSGRMKKIKRLVNKMLVVFPFEEKLYKNNNVDVEFVGHPLVERINKYQFLRKEDLYNKFDIDGSKELLLLMPGSRKHEVEKLFPQIINAAGKLADEFNLQIVIACSSIIDENLYYQLRGQLEFKVITGYTYDLMKYAKFGIVKSGTSTLEAGYFALPMIIVYKISGITYLIVKKLIKVSKIGMVNILLEDNVVPELIQNDVSERKIYIAGKKILSDKEYYNSVKEKLNKVKHKLGNEGASARAAKHIYELMNEA